MPFVLDASVALVWCFEDEQSLYADAVREVLDRDDAWVPSIWALEVSSGLRNGERRRRITEAQVLRRTQQLLAMRILEVAVPADLAFGRLIDLSRRFDLTIYDAAYLDLAMSQTLALASLDRDLLAAMQAVGVPFFDPR